MIDKNNKRETKQQMATSIKRLIHGKISIKNEQIQLTGNEKLYISIRDSLRHDIDCIEIGLQIIHLRQGQQFPIDYQCSYDPNKTQMKFEQLRTIPGALTISAMIEQDEQILYINDTDIPFADECDIQLIKMDNVSSVFELCK